MRTAHDSPNADPVAAACAAAAAEAMASHDDNRDACMSLTGEIAQAVERLTRCERDMVIRSGQFASAAETMREALAALEPARPDTPVAQRMAEVMRDLLASKQDVSHDDLIQRGFTEMDIVHHHSEAIALVRAAASFEFLA